MYYNVHAMRMHPARYLVVVVIAFRVGFVLDYEVFRLLFDARPASSVDGSRGGCVGRGRFLRYRIASVDPV